MHVQRTYISVKFQSLSRFRTALHLQIAPLQLLTGHVSVWIPRRCSHFYFEFLSSTALPVIYRNREGFITIFVIFTLYAAAGSFISLLD